jgi:PAS domain S-box-containing protein
MPPKCTSGQNHALSDAVFTVDHNWRITSFSKGAEAITGWKAGDVIGSGFHDLFGADERFSALCRLQPDIAAGKAVIDLKLSFAGQGIAERVCVLVSALPVLDPAGQPRGAVVVLRREDRVDFIGAVRHEFVLESLADGVFTVDRNWRITFFNRAAEQITGWAREDALSKSCSEVFRSSICGENCAIAMSLYSGKQVVNRSISIRGLDGERIPISISAAPLIDHEGNVIGGVETFRDLRAVADPRRRLSKGIRFSEIISKSPVMQRIFAIMPEIARSESNVLVLGESGTGKELVASAIHSASPRHKGPFVAVNCGALPETLLESELFGYKAGAFTDARQDRAGRFAVAEKGTLFLDEIGDIPAALQVKLLRVLQSKVYEPLGSNQSVKADVRIVAATNRDLQALVEEGLFREDLFYRLNVVKIHLPPLRKRKEDIPMLVEHFIKQFSAQKSKDIVGISEGALAKLMHYEYPGNIRELENIIEYSFILCHGGFIQPEHLPEPFAPAESDEGSGALLLEKPRSLEAIEGQAIYRALERNRWRRLATCRELGISKDTLRRKIQRYGLRDPLGEEQD